MLDWTRLIYNSPTTSLASLYVWCPDRRKTANEIGARYTKEERIMKADNYHVIALPINFASILEGIP
jgi:hypothetical protein